MIDSYYFGKCVRKSKILSVIISFKKDTSKIDAESEFKRVYLSFYLIVQLVQVQSWSPLLFS